MADSLPVLSRPREGAMIAGVCAGLARRWHIDPIVVRVIVAALVFAGGLGVALYVAGVASMPRDGASGIPLGKLLPFTRSWPAAGVATAVTVVLVAVFWATGVAPGFGALPVVAVVLVIAFAVSRRRRTSARPHVAEPTPFERQAQAWRQRLAENQGVALPEAIGTTPTTPPELPPEANPVRRRSHGWLIALGLAALSVGTLAVLAVVGVTVPRVAYAAAVLASLGVGLLASVSTRRPRGLMPVTVLAALPVIWILFR